MSRSHREVLREYLDQDPAFRNEWERTAFARAVAAEVIRYRAEHSLSQTALARKLDVSQPVIGRLELGEHEPKVSTLQKLASVLGLTFTVKIEPIPAASANGASEPGTARARVLLSVVAA